MYSPIPHGYTVHKILNVVRLLIQPIKCRFYVTPYPSLKGYVYNSTVKIVKIVNVNN